MKSIRTLTSKYVRNENGATAIEYGLIAALVSIAALTAFQAIGPRLLATFNNVSTGLQ
ncbi:pilus assembly protein [Paramagnetospirillum marisnigri]|uniref:Pilus assembly protein n=1 Tax=Paramagnetospirillum marisnigri TaxID=1285242 RepID=A0A178MQX7_9PROT|nr:pilus assembly protein [Paramagnetospirillum marisnigri]